MGPRVGYSVEQATALNTNMTHDNPNRDSTPKLRIVRPDDPDAAGLPPNVELPEPRAFRRDQLRALAASNAAGLMIILICAGISSGRAVRLLQILAALLAVLLVVNTARWLLARRAASKVD